MARRTRVIGAGPAPRVTRRGLLVGAAATGGLLIAWRLWPRDYRGGLIAGEGETLFGPWLSIGTDGVVTVAVPQLEMGQGVTTLLPQIVAHELGADWRQIAVQPVAPSGAQPNAALAAHWAELWRGPLGLTGAERFARDTAFAATADGTTLAAYEAPARAAGATARALLAMAAAARWYTDWERCDVRGGLVMQGGRQAGFGALATEAASLAPPDDPPLRPLPPQEVPLGDPAAGSEALALVYPRLDLPSKVDGSAVFAGDVRVPGLLFAAIRHAPLGAELSGFDRAAGERRPGVRHIVRNPGWLAVVADSWWQADRALAAMKPRFTGGTPADARLLPSWLNEAVKSAGTAIESRGDADSQLAAGEGVFAATYTIAPAFAAPVETASATARLSDGRLELWIAAQAPEAARRAAAAAAGVAPRHAVLYPMPAGGSFDARLEHGHAAEVAAIARAVGRPVQLTWSRAEELATAPPRAPIAVALAARLDTDSRLPVAWRARVAGPATNREFGARLFGGASATDAIADARGRADPLACEGAAPPYALRDLTVEHCPVSVPFATGRMRGNAPAYTAFATEGFVDELARRAARDPLLYRLGMLGNQPRLAEVLQRAARLGRWDGGAPGSGQGLALARMAAPGGDADAAGGGRIACVARARMGPDGPLVESLAVAVDIGRIVNLDIARQQIEGGLLFGLGLARGGALALAEGARRPGRLAELRFPALADTPEILIDFVASQAPPFDPGELGAVVAPPAIANALFAATGLRYRSLPLLTGTA